MSPIRGNGKLMHAFSVLICLELDICRVEGCVFDKMFPIKDDGDVFALLFQVQWKMQCLIASRL